MKTMSYSVIKGICAVIMGILLVTWPETAILYLVIAIGAMFLVPGAVAVLNYIFKGREQGAMFPIVSVGSLLFGLWLMISPALTFRSNSAATLISSPSMAFWLQRAGGYHREVSRESPRPLETEIS